MATQVPLMPPEGFDFAHPDSWTKWKKRFERYRLASGLSEKDEAVQVNALIYAMGDAAEEIFDSFGLSETDAKKYDKVSKAFRNTLLCAITQFMNEQDSTSGRNNLVKVLIPSSHPFIDSQSIASTVLYENK